MPDDGRKALQDLLGISAIVETVKQAFANDQTRQFISTSVSNGIRDAVTALISTKDSREKLVQLFSDAAKSIVANQDFRSQLVATFSEILITFVNNLVKNNKDLFQQAIHVIMEDKSGANIKESVASAVYDGLKYAVTDEEMLKNFSYIFDMALQSKAMGLLSKNILNGVSLEGKNFLQGAEFKGVLLEVANQVLASNQEALNMAVQRGISNLKGVKLLMQLAPTEEEKS